MILWLIQVVMLHGAQILMNILLTFIIAAGTADCIVLTVGAGATALAMVMPVMVDTGAILTGEHGILIGDQALDILLWADMV